jgi:hypothetical protein
MEVTGGRVASAGQRVPWRSNSLPPGGRPPRLPPLFRPGRRPLPARRPNGNRFALGSKHTPPLPSSTRGRGRGRGSRLRRSLQRTGRALRQPRRRWRPLSPPVRTNGLRLSAHALCRRNPLLKRLSRACAHLQLAASRC